MRKKEKQYTNKKTQVKHTGLTKFFGRILEFYLRHYFSINLIFNLIIISLIKSPYALFLLIISFIEFLNMRKNVKPYKLQSMQFIDRCRSYHTMIFLGPVRSGKTSLSKYILNMFCTNPNLRYSSCEMPGYRVFTHDHLFGKTELAEGACVHVSEAGGFYDSFQYDKKYDNERFDIMNFNKYFGQNYGNDAYLVYEDQSSSNMNTILKRTVVYYVLNLSVSPACKPIIPYIIYKIINSIFKLTTYNLFSLVAYDYKDFIKLDDFAEHYEINYDALTDKRFIVPAFRVFSGYDTRVFKQYNKAKKDRRPYVWGTDKAKDKEYMKVNYKLDGKIEEISKNKKRG